MLNSGVVKQSAPRSNSIIFFYCPILLSDNTLDNLCALHFTLLHFKAFLRRFCPKPIAVIHTYIDTLMAVAAMYGADQHHQ